MKSAAFSNCCWATWYGFGLLRADKDSSADSTMLPGYHTPTMATPPVTVETPPRLRGAARALTLEIAAEARAEWGFATDLVATAFRRNRQPGSHDRRLVAETVYGLVRSERRLEAIADELLARRRERREPLS